MRIRRSLLPLILLTVVACSTNPATGKREINIVSESQEIAMGQQSHPEILRQFGRYDEKPELARRVEEVGRSLASRSPRPNLPWTFTILDTPMVNAMALPGGYIYITRGMLERINSDDELAGVLGHEIAHVTARHAAQQMTRAQLAQFGMILGSVLAGPEATQAYGQIAELGVGLLFQKYSRSQESQADIYGTEYTAIARFNPIGAERMLMTLQRLDKNPSGGLDRYFESHPDPAKRVQDVRRKIAEMQKMNPTTTYEAPDRERFVPLLNGIITGNSTENVVIKNGYVYDRAHGMVLKAPQGWRPYVSPGMLFALAPRGNSQSSFIAQEVSTQQLQGYNAQDAVRRSFQGMGLQYVGERQARARSGQTFPVDAWVGQTNSGQVGVETTQFPHGDHVAVFMFLSPSLNRNQSPLGDVLQQASFDANEARRVQPPRMRTGTARAGESWQDLARRSTGDAADAEVIANMNGFDLRDPVPARATIKLPEDVVRDTD